MLIVSVRLRERKWSSHDGRVMVTNVMADRRKRGNIDRSATGPLPVGDRVSTLLDVVRLAAMVEMPLVTLCRRADEVPDTEPAMLIGIRLTRLRGILRLFPQGSTSRHGVRNAQSFRQRQCK